MAKQSTEPKRDTRVKPAKGSLQAEDGPFAEASAALSRGDVRSARKSLAQLPGTAAEDDRIAAKALSSRLGLDLTAVAIALGVLVMIALSATFALFLRHG
jgi:hypothetical protein